MEFLKINEIGTIKQWGGFSIAHFEKLGYSIDNFPSTKSLFDELMLLPMNHMMKDYEIEEVANNIIKFFQ